MARHRDHSTNPWVVFLIVVLTFVPLLASDSRSKSSFSKGAGRERPADRSTQSDLHRQEQREKEDNDPCDHLLDPPGKAEGIRKRCLHGGSSSGIAKGDFNGDGFGDLAIGIPDEDDANVQDAGAVNVIYGSFGSGLVAPSTAGIVPRSQFWSQSSPGVPGTSESGDGFGSALAAGDFNDDGFSDLAIGIPGENINAFGSAYPNAGAVVVIYGSQNGLTTTDPDVPTAKFFDVGSGFPQGEAAVFGGERVGASLAWGDFDGDGTGDLAIGLPGFHAEFTSEAGAIWVLSGTRPSSTIGGGPLPHGGLVTDHSTLFDANAFASSPQSDANLGTTLAAGDFNGDTFTDLAIGIPDETFGRREGANAGQVAVIYGVGGVGLSPDGLHTELLVESDFISIPPFNGNLAAGDRFGSALAAGDFNGDGRVDLAIGTPDNDGSQAISNIGAVFVYYGTTVGLRSGTRQAWSQNALFGANSGEKDDAFGFALAAGDFDGDGIKDLAIGVPGEDIDAVRNGATVNVVNAGEVDVLYGSSSSGLSINVDRPRQSWTQESANIAGTAGTNDFFGLSLTAWNFGRTQIIAGPPQRFLSADDLAIGVPFEDILTATDDAGGVNVIYGSNTGLTSNGNQFWSQATANISGSPEPGDHFGKALY